MLRRIALAAIIVTAINGNCAAAEPSTDKPVFANEEGFVLFPGGSQADGLEWKAVVAYLSLPAIAMEMPHGATANMTRDAYISFVLGTMDRAGIKRAILVGHSGGGLIVPAIAIRAPNRVSQSFPSIPLASSRGNWARNTGSFGGGSGGLCAMTVASEPGRS